MFVTFDKVLLFYFPIGRLDSSGCGHMGPRGVCDMEIGMFKCMMVYIKTKGDDGSYYCDSKKIVKTVYLFQDNTKTLPQKCLGIISLI